MRRLQIVGVMLVLVILVGVVAVAPLPLILHASAQTAAPTPDDGRDVPQASECTVAPLTLEQLQTIFAKTTAATSSPVAVHASPTTGLSGEPVDAATADAVRAAVRLLVACSNAGDLWRLLATYSERYVQIYLQAYIDPKTGITDLVYQAYAEASPAPPERQTGILQMGDPVRQPDGRVAIAITADDPGDGVDPRETIFYLVPSSTGDGRWLIDDFVFSPLNAG